jgi:hypothetical protein
MRRRGRTNGFFLLGRNEPARLIGEVLDARGNDGAAMDSRQRSMVAQIIQILADGLRRDLETPGEILHHHPAEGAGDIEDFRLAVSKAGHDGTSDKNAPHGAAVPASGQRGRSASMAVRWAKERILVKATCAGNNHNQSRENHARRCSIMRGLLRS